MNTGQIAVGHLHLASPQPPRTICHGFDIHLCQKDELQQMGVDVCYVAGQKRIDTTMGAMCCMNLWNHGQTKDKLLSDIHIFLCLDPQGPFVMGLAFICVKKTATTGCPIQHVGKMQLLDHKRSHHDVATLSFDNKKSCQLLAVARVNLNHDRRCMISPCSSLSADWCICQANIKSRSATNLTRSAWTDMAHNMAWLIIQI